MNRIRVSIWALLLSGALLTGTAQAQIASSEFFGTVRDASGAMVPRAALSLVSRARGFEQKTISNDQGVFLFPNLTPGLYDLRVEKEGFRPYARTGVQAVTARRVELTVELVLADVTQAVHVEATAPLLETGGHETGTTVDNTRITQLPLNGRSYLELAPLAHNTIRFETGQPRQGAGFVLGGSRFNSNNLMVDGIDNNTIFFNRDVVRPSVDSIEEFRVITNSPDAQYGRNMGGVVTVVTKSGTNQLHGSAFEYHRNQELNARNAFSSVPSPYFLRNQYGASLGGPVLKQRVFFFGNFEKLRQRESAASNLNVPSMQLRSGVFPTSTPVYNPATTRLDAATGKYVRDPFPGNVIPESAMDSVGKTIVRNAFPASNIGANTYRVQVPRGQDEDQWMVRGDYRQSDRVQWYGRYSTYSTFTNGKDAFPVEYSGAASPVNIGHNAVLSSSQVLSPSMFNSLRLGFNRFQVDQKPLNFGTDPAGAIGLKGTNPSKAISSFPSIQTGYSDFGSGSNFLVSAEDTFQISDDFSWTRGGHSVKAGMDLRYLRANVFGSFVPFGQIRFGSIYSSNPSQANTGDVIADLLLGYPQSVQLNVQFSPLYNRQTLLGGYIQDDWRVTPKLTLNLGLRYEIFGPVVDKYDRQANPDMTNPAGQFRIATRGGKVPDYIQREIAQLPIPAAERARLFVPGDSRALTNTNWFDFSPRLGAAWQWNSRTVLRAGGGVYRSITGGGTFVRLGFNAPNFIETFFIAPDAVTPIARLQDGIPSFQQGSGRIDGVSPRHLFENNRTQTTVQGNLTLQRQLDASTVVEAGYLMSRGRNLTLFLLENQIRNQADYGKGQTARPVPLFGNVWGWGSGAVSRYHAGFVKVERRMTKGVSVLASHTFGRSLDNASGDFLIGNAGISTAPIDSFDISREYGRSAFDTANRTVVSLLYELPFGRGRHWLSGGGVADVFLGGWSISSMGLWQSGLPIDMRTQTTRTFSFNNQNRPDRVGDGNLPSGQRTVDRWFDTSAFVNPADYKLGNAGRNPVTAPGLFNIDSTIGKEFPFRERVRLQVRGEFFNLFNTVNLNAPNNFVGNPSFGKILGSRAARQVQFALRLSF